MARSWDDIRADLEAEGTLDPRPSDGSALDPWDNLPPHLHEALREALEGLREAFLDHAHPFSPALQAVWDVTDQIEAYILAREQETFGSRE